MCGRYSQVKDPATLADEFDAVDATGEAWSGPEYNVAPTMTVVGVVDRHPRDAEGTPDPSTVERSLRAMRWGLVPSWAKDESIGNRMINARAESLADKPAFRRAAASRRCLLPADGWFEWHRGERSDRRRGGEGSQKTPYFMTYARDSAYADSSLALAGLWETWRPKDAARGTAPLVSTTVVTVASAGALAGIHDRMPLVLPRERWAQWLDPDHDDPSGLLAPADALLSAIELRPVSSKVNNVRNHGPELLEEVDPDAEPGPERDEQPALDLEVGDRG